MRAEQEALSGLTRWFERRHGESHRAGEMDWTCRPYLDVLLRTVRNQRGGSSYLVNGDRVEELKLLHTTLEDAYARVMG
ncbi:hypothetical protein CLV92_10581 [Kineococcus xinjiangensis]|uniref:Uncharacterized protein n=1 Tax=Kineococcus xinjiangensis TaxID=512762 RepID=A0A2S6IP75_9ACTN|nr:hypothetical protein [Kineococcus xinjiangensis]PPK95981.1 hypothetical protein CLV92_10581 [Kineococcus xinjiangensis]